MPWRRAIVEYGTARVGWGTERLKTWLVREGFEDDEDLMAVCREICGDGFLAHVVTLEKDTTGKVHFVLRQRGPDKIIMRILCELLDRGRLEEYRARIKGPGLR